MSSIRAPFRRRLTAAQTGLDPRTHYWYRAGNHDYRRVCDDAQWIRLLGRPNGQECRLCLAMRLADQRLGWRAFSLTYQRKGVFALDGSPYALSSQAEADAMPQVTMFKFAEFCVGDSSKRGQIISKREADRKRRENLRQRSEEPRGGGYYAGLLKVLREQHWETNDIEQLDAAVFDLDLNKRGNSRKIETYQYLKERYVDTWRAQDARYFKVTRAQVAFGGLRVTVDPEVGMRTSTADRAFKLRFSKQEVSTNLLDVCNYLLWEAASYAEWPRPWRPGIWGVYHSRLVDAQSPPDHIEEWVHQCAAEFVALSSP